MHLLILRRLLQAIPTLWVIATATFILLQLTPGGPFDSEKDVSEEVQAIINAHYGLDLPVHEQYLRFLGQRLRGDFGPSYKYAGWDVDEIIAQSFPVSLELASTRCWWHWRWARRWGCWRRCGIIDPRKVC